MRNQLRPEASPIDGTTSVPARRRDPAGKRERIVEAALDLFAERGYACTGIVDICHRAGVSIGTFYHSFEGKRDLIEQIASLDRALNLSSAALADVDRLEAALIDFLTGDGLRLWPAWREAVLVEPPLLQVEAELSEQVRQRLIASVADARRSHGLDAGSDRAATIAWLTMAIVRESMRRGPGKPESMASVVARAIQLLVFDARL